MRITENILANTFLRNVLFNNQRLARVQDQLASGKVITSPAQDPSIANQVLDLNDHVNRANEYVRNAKVGSTYLEESDAVLAGINELTIRARTLAVNMANGTISAAQRAGTSEEVDQILNQVVDSANRRFRGRYIFAGRNVTQAPFEITNDGVLYTGDTGRLSIRTSDNSKNAINVTGLEAFGAFGAGVNGSVDLDPALSLAADGTRMKDLLAGKGVEAHFISVTYGVVPTTVTVDLNGSEFLEDVKARIEDATGSAVTVGIDGTGHALTLTGAGNITVAEANDGHTASELGILGSGAGVLTGSDLDPVITPLTKVSQLFNGGLDTSGFVITNGSGSVTITAADLGGSVQDLLAKLNTSPANVYAEISADGRKLDIYSRLSGATMVISENGGTTAAQMGIATAGVRAENLITALMDLSTALKADDQNGTFNTISHFDDALQNILSARAEVGARVQRFEYADKRNEEDGVNMTKLLSAVNDVDYAKAVMDYQQLNNAMQAAFRVAATSLPMSLADFL